MYVESPSESGVQQRGFVLNAKWPQRNPDGSGAVPALSKTPGINAPYKTAAGPTAFVLLVARLRHNMGDSAVPIVPGSAKPEKTLCWNGAG